MITKSRLFPSFFAGFLAAVLTWGGALEFITDKPVPNAVFTQTIVEAKLNAAREVGDGGKAVFTGGSNVLFGVDSKQFGQETGRPSLNFGCAAGLGPELILHLLKPMLKQGDLVVMCWEFGHYKFTRSGQVDITYLNILFGPQRDFRRNLPVQDRLSLALNLPTSHVRKAIGTAFNPYVDAEIYRCQWAIDSRGNLRSNQGKKISKTELLEKPLSSVVSTMEISRDARDIFSKFVQYCHNQEVTLLASWPNIFAHPDYFNNQRVAANFKTIELFWKDQDVEVVGNPFDAMFQADYFHDTIYHLNSEGVAIRTAKLTKDLKPWLATEAGSTGN